MRVQPFFTALTLLSSLCLNAHAEPSTTAPAAQALDAPTLVVDGKVDHPLSLTPADISKLPHVEAKVKDHGGKETTYSGVPLRTILVSAGAPLGSDHMRGPALRLFLIATGADGYKVVFGLAEFDAEYAERNVLLADSRDGQPLSAKEGPFRLVVPQEAKQGRWVRQLTTLTIREAD